nr:two-component regulator propeller domain-containing protein [Pseudomarimonas arenosa]
MARFIRLDSRSGLSQDTPLALVQDRHGFVWIGTQDGLNRFDGQQVRVLRAEPDQPGGLKSSWITALVYDRQQRLWVGSHRGVHRYDEAQDRFQHYDLAPGHSGGDTIYTLYLDVQGELWVGSDAGLSRYQRDSDTFTTYSATGETLADFGAGQVRAIVRHGEDLWVGTTAGLFRFNIELEQFNAVDSLGSLVINALSVDRSGVLWVGSDQQGLLRFAPDRAEAQKVELEHPRVHALLLDSSGSLWVGGEQAAYRLRPERPLTQPIERYAHRERDPFSIGRGRVPSFLEARDGSFWIGAWEGGVSWTDARFNTVRSLTLENQGLGALSDPRVLAVASEGENFWLGTADAVARYEPGSGELQPLPSTRGMFTFTLLVRPDALWIGSGLGVYRFDRQTEQLSRQDLHPDVNQARIRRMMLDGDRLWVFAELAGLYVFDLSSGELIQRHRFVGNVYYINRLDQERVLATASDGLHWFSRDGRQRLHQQEIGNGSGLQRLPAPISGYVRDSRGRLWLASYGAGGFEMREPRAGDAASAEFHPIPALQSLSNQGVNSLQVDAQDRLWLATDRGISLFDPALDEVRNLDDVDGALVRGYYFSASAQAPAGLLAFGSKEGLSLLDTRDSIEHVRPPSPLLTGVSISNQWQQVQSRMPESVLPQAPFLLDQIGLRPGMGRSIGFRFASPAYTEGRRLRYLYRLDGFDTEWVKLEVGRRETGYTNLPPGDYRLRIKAESGWGERSAETAVSFNIAPYWWQTWWSRVLWVLLSVGVILGLLRWRMARLRAVRVLLEQQVRERTLDLERARQQAERSLRDLEVTQEELVRSEKLSALGGLVASVAHEVNTPLGVALTANSHLGDRVRQLEKAYLGGQMARSDLSRYIDAAKEGADMIQRNLERAAGLISSFKRVSADRSSDERRRFDLAQVLDELLQSLKLLWKRRSIVLEIDCPPGIQMDSFPGALGQILTNLAQNAVLHAFSGRDAGLMQIKVVKVDDKNIELRFSDNGIGIADEHLKHIFEPFYTTRRDQGGTGLGLHIVHNLVKQVLAGRVTVSSELGKGTEFVIELPTVAPHSESLSEPSHG